MAYRQLQDKEVVVINAVNERVVPMRIDGQQSTTRVVFAVKRVGDQIEWFGVDAAVAYSFDRDGNPLGHDVVLQWHRGYTRERVEVDR